MATKLIVLVASLLAGHLVVGYPTSYYSGYDDYKNSGSGYEQYAHAPSPYRFEYGVKDTHTHDIKSQNEESDGHGNVKGSYSLVEPDGSIRVVEYTADDVHGFKAVVKKIEAPAGHYYHGEHSSSAYHQDEYTYPYQPSSSPHYID